MFCIVQIIFFFANVFTFFFLEPREFLAYIASVKFSNLHFLLITLWMFVLFECSREILLVQFLWSSKCYLRVHFGAQIYVSTFSMVGRNGCRLFSKNFMEILHVSTTHWHTCLVMDSFLIFFCYFILDVLRFFRGTRVYQVEYCTQGIFSEQKRKALVR